VHISAKSVSYETKLIKKLTDDILFSLGHSSILLGEGTNTVFIKELKFRNMYLMSKSNTHHLNHITSPPVTFCI
jgi:hypothetical protein